MTREQGDGPRLELPPVPEDQRGHEVAAWREQVLIDTYAPEDPDPYPAFLDNRVYQGSSGRVYPLPFYERVAAKSRPMRWDAVHLENRWLRVMVLPALGGRIHVGFDKAAGYDFFYRSNVIKPALVGLTGPWASGGVEFNWPQHHRPGTFLPVDVEIEREPDGAVTVWGSDHDPFTRMKGMHGVRLRPGSALLELRVRLYNRTEDVQTFLWWANAAVRVHDDYQSFFPPDVRFVADHARRATTAYPRASGRYYGVDYPARVGPGSPDADRLDWYRNIPVPTSFMCLGSADDFLGGYDHRAEAGFVHWADHRIAPGKKQWTWGNAAFGRAWERNLTDGDGPYIELMAGVHTDNQPDFSFLAPGETKAFSQFWYPIQRIGPPQRATPDAAISLTIRAGDQAGEDTLVRVGAAVTAPRPGCLVLLRDADQRVVWSAQADLAPGSPLVEEVRLEARDIAGLELAVEHGGEVLARWRPGPGGTPPEPTEPPEPATEPPAPEDLSSADELYLTGLHLEQYRHATRSPEPYWREALRRDPGDARCNLALAARRYRAADYAAAEELLRRAVARLTHRNPNPYDGEAHYRLGLTLTRLGRLDEAADALAKATWNAAWRAPAHLALARLHCRAGRWEAALDDLGRALAVDTGLLQARDLRVLVLRRLGRTTEAGEQSRAGRALDPLDWWARDLAGEPPACDAATCLDVALDYAGAGFTADALRVLDRAEQRLSGEAGYAGDTAPDAVPQWGRPRSGLGPLIDYHRAALLAALGDHDGAEHAGRRARAGDPAYCFPHRLEDHAVLTRALEHDPADGRAASLLGHWLYHHRRHADAIAAWSRAVEVEPGDVVAWRNLGIGAFNIERDPERAVACYERALALAPGDARLWYERDQLAERTGEAPERRLHRLEGRPGVIAARDDLTIAYVLLLLAVDRAEDALTALTGRRFQPWEGGEGRVLAAWEQTRLALARAALAAGRPADAQAHAEAALDPPESLGETRHPLANRAEPWLMLGDACAANSRPGAAAEHWTLTATADGDFRQMSPQAFSETTRFSALAWRRLGRPGRAARLIDGLAAYLAELRGTPARIDYFTTSLPTMLLFDDDLQARQDTRVEFLAAQLAALRGRRDTALAHLAEVLAREPAHLPARALRAELAALRS
ncbi:DUF5107 domain-containing protein [Actinomadura scrupuli]|uniref:DUF5107 domain-containing protein n=1 Tax=Actinomadura scrupuli TaxID=559629 RepID=UPI003D98B616